MRLINVWKKKKNGMLELTSRRGVYVSVFAMVWYQIQSDLIKKNFS